VNKNKREIFALPNDANGVGEKREDRGCGRGLKLILQRVLELKKYFLPLHSQSEG
jgi:hypothetical protein